MKRAYGKQAVLPLFRSAARAKASHQKPMRVAGLFAGVGGLELGLHRAGHEATMLCEIDLGARAVLSARFPELPLHDDVTTLAQLPKSTELLVAGFPCQDLSQAGKTAGIEGARSGLVGEVFRLLAKREVPWVLLENVPFMLQLAKGGAMEVIVAAFEALGYRWAYRVIDSRAFGLPQRRERVYFLASLEGDPRQTLFAEDAGEPSEPRVSWKRANGFYWTEGVRGLGWANDAVPTLKGGSSVGIPSPPAIVMPNGSVVTPHIRDAERMQGFEAGWTEPAETVTKRGARWKLVGNAVTVDVAHWIGRRLCDPSQAGADTPAEPLVRQGAWPRTAFNVGEGRFEAYLSAWPQHQQRIPLHQFLQHPPTRLSAKATAGFLGRTKHASLRFPDGFLDRLHRHLQAMTGDGTSVQAASL